MAFPRTRTSIPVLAGLTAVLLLGAILRLWGIGNGAPYRMGVDEPIILETSHRMIRTGDFNPHFFDYGGLTITFHAAVSAISFLDGARRGRWRSLNQTWFGNFLVATRTATALIGALTILVVFRVGLRWGPRVALAAALVFAVLPPHVRESHYTLTDTPLTFLVALTLLLSVRAAESTRWTAIAAAGLAVGLAAAVKYNGAIVGLLPALAACSFPAGQRLRVLGLAAVSSVAGFLVAAPFTLLDLPAFLNAFAVLAQDHIGVRMAASDAAWTYVGHLRNWFGWPGVIPLGFGYLGVAMTAVGLLLALRRHGAPTPAVGAMIALFPLAYVVFVASQSVRVYGRYLLPIAPMLAIGLAISILGVADAVSRRWAPTRKAALPAMLAILVGPLAAASVGWNIENARPITLDLTARWVATHTEPGQIVVIEGASFNVPDRVTLRRVFTLIDRTLEDYRTDGVDYLVASSEVSDTFAGRDDAVAAYRALLSRTEVVQTFSPTAVRRGPTITILKISP